MAVDYVRRQVVERPAHLLAERAFQQEALLNPRLHELVRSHRLILQQGVTHFFQVLGSNHPVEDAKLFTGIVERLEYQGLIDGPANMDSAEMLALLKRYIYLVLGL